MTEGTFQLQWRSKQGGDWVDYGPPRVTYCAALRTATPHRHRIYRVVPSSWSPSNLHKLTEYDGGSAMMGEHLKPIPKGKP